MGDYDPGDFELHIISKNDAGASGTVVFTPAEFTGLDDWKEDKNPEYNEGPGGQIFGFIHRRHSNKVSFNFTVKESSKNMQALQKLIHDETPCRIVAIVRASDSKNYDENMEIGLGCDYGIISGGSRSKGKEGVNDVTFEVLGKTALTFYKSKPLGTTETFSSSGIPSTPTA